ncbi:peptidoglycan DD-metalloendopeptidase family protein [Heliobacterium undosum]|uniref:Peptidoglycan DD-metalloendopeptidase family protein n=2 Tax=Heliomicrobium undosum TaxID=121734 RepID=A0A845L3W7_9FIRM|nr:peptidoglycan DD-metalloendopeptidase family protein [Heliomicrobium undosum]
MIKGTTGEPVTHWGSPGYVTKVDATVGLVAIYCSDINETIFYRHMNSIQSGIQQGSYVSHGQQIGTEGSKGNSSGTHLHCGVEWASKTSDASGSDSDFTSQNIYYAMQYFGY